MILRYLSWDRQLFQHPDYQRNRNRDVLIHGRGTPCIKNYAEDDGRQDLLQVYRNLNADWPRLAPAFRFRVELVSSSFIEAVDQARDAFANNQEVCREYLKGKTFDGTLLIPHLNSSVSFHLRFNPDGTGFDEEDIFQVGDSDCIVLYKGDGMAFATETIHLADVKTGKTAPIEESNKLDGTLDYLDNLESLLVNYFCFKRFANVTEKMIAGTNGRQQKRRDPDDDLNESGVTVRRMDATYFTTTVRTEGFPRRGFFRMQRYKEGGEWVHRLKWIDATYVSGYTRKAKKLLAEKI